MQYFEDVTITKEQIHAWKADGYSIALVPTLGNLHAGHLSLVKNALKLADKTVVSIFVNPTQFVQGEDFENYPRTLSADLEKLRSEKVDLVFCPAVENIYSDSEDQTRVTVSGLENRFCGASRPGHFAGVATVVLKLFNIIEPDMAIFGEKDYQQLLVIRQMVRDLFIPVSIIGMPTVREKDGLAMSSRNHYLDNSQRQIAAGLYRVLQDTAEAIRSGETDFAALEKQSHESLNRAGFRTDYFAICDASTLGTPAGGDIIVLAAAWLGKARLIDNVLIRR